MKKKYNRFFAFGCSFTRFMWPTWADIIGLQYNNSTYYNYGYPGSGNHYIFNAVMEADQRHKFTPEDLIIVQWTTNVRYDYYFENKWKTLRLQNTPDPENIDRNFYENYFDERGFIMRDIAMIKAVRDSLSNIGCAYKFIAMESLLGWINELEKKKIEHKDIVDLYDDVLQEILPSYAEYFNGCHNYRPTSIRGNRISDGHPIPSVHDVYIKNILPEFWIDNSELIKELDIESISMIEKNTWDWDHDWKKINKPILGQYIKL